ncbi:MAG: hypothetical protein V3R60_03675 [Acidobacteriota bacterium]
MKTIDEKEREMYEKVSQAALSAAQEAIDLEEGEKIDWEYVLVRGLAQAAGFQVALSVLPPPHAEDNVAVEGFPPVYRKAIAASVDKIRLASTQAARRVARLLKKAGIPLRSEQLPDTSEAAAWAGRLTTVEALSEKRPVESDSEVNGDLAVSLYADVEQEYKAFVRRARRRGLSSKEICWYAMQVLQSALLVLMSRYIDAEGKTVGQYLKLSPPNVTKKMVHDMLDDLLVTLESSEKG